MNRRIIAVFITALLTLAAMPLSLAYGAVSPRPARPAETAWTVPEGYNEHDCSALLTFLEAPSAVEGKKNGQMLNPDYDPNDISTFSYDPSFGDSNTYSIAWEFVESANEYRLASIDIRNKHGLAGTLDLSSCIYLKAISLYDLPELTGLNIAVCSRLETLYCSACGVESVDAAKAILIT